MSDLLYIASYSEQNFVASYMYLATVVATI